MSDILDRAETTHNVVGLMTEWQWPERSLQQWEEGIEELRARRGEQSTAQTVIQVVSGELGFSMEAIHDLTTAVVRLGRVRYRANPHQLRVFDFVKPDAKSRASILGAAERLAELWRKLDGAWVPLENVTLDDFDLLLAQCAEVKKKAVAADVDWLLAGAAVGEAAAALDGDCVAWYATATAVFSDDTTRGKFIRRQVPTTTVPQPPPDQSEITQLILTAEGGLRLQYEAKHGTRFTVLYRGPGDEQFRTLAVDVKEKFLELKDVAKGAHHFKVMASNSRGDGAVSEEAVVEVLAAKAA